MNAERSSEAAPSKVRFFLLEGLNGLGAALYFNYYYFFLQEHFHFSDRNRLLVASLHGAVYTVMSRAAGRIADRIGYLKTFRAGCTVVTAALCFGATFSEQSWAQVLGIVFWTLGICLTWPPLQAMVAEGESRSRTAQLIGIYNLVWAGFAGVANFLGGWLYEHGGPRTIFLIPALFSLVMVGISSLWIYRARQGGSLRSPQAPDPQKIVPRSNDWHPHPLNPVFLTLARVANPFAYVAINTVIPLIPKVASGLRLTQSESGWVSSVWFFGRWMMFLLLWQWPGWHYRRHWLVMSYLGMVAGFVSLLLAPTLLVLVLAQALFGVSIGLIYYSSLFYSMDAAGEKGTHGGLHEAAIGLGTCVGPAVGALAMELAPGGHAAAWGVTALLLCGFAAVVALVRRVPAKSD